MLHPRPTTPQLEDWEAFDVFRLADLTGGRPLQAVTLGLLRQRGLLARLGLPEQRVRSFLADVEEAYHPHNPYHNSSHAADVTQASGQRAPPACPAGACLRRLAAPPAFIVPATPVLQTSTAAAQLGKGLPCDLLPCVCPALQALGAMLSADDFAAQLSDLEQLAVIVAAAIHDVGHPGVNNDFLIRTQSEVGWPLGWAMQARVPTMRQLPGAQYMLWSVLRHARCVRRAPSCSPACVVVSAWAAEAGFVAAHALPRLQAAVAYNDQSINENMHAAAGFKLLAKKENNFLSRWAAPGRRPRPPPCQQTSNLEAASKATTLPRLPEASSHCWLPRALTAAACTTAAGLDSPAGASGAAAARCRACLSPTLGLSTAAQQCLRPIVFPTRSSGKSRI